MQKYGKKNNIQRYFCSSCHKTFSSTNKLNPIDIWTDYTIGKQTYKQLAEKYHCSIRTIQRYIEKSPKAKLTPLQQTYLNIIADVTFFGRDFGVLVLMDILSKKAVYHRVVKTEKDLYYKLALNILREKGYRIQSITNDGRRGLLKDLFNTSIQMCHFHMVAIVMRKLRKKHQSQAGKELKIIVKTLKESHKNEFYLRLHQWYLKHKEFLDERAEYPNEKGYFPYKHRNVRGAYASLKYYMKYLFTFEEYTHLNIEKTTNRLEGLFKELKQKLSIHNGLTKKHKIMFIKDFLNKKSW
ncbi:IS256 family transposase, variant Zn-binding type [Gallibacterium anatis]|uniref:IS256 family transposase, variant Zn-binding type n=1 Tax=Gallibacterium anatis TaxID=750 RepID=UPI003F5840C6